MKIFFSVLLFCCAVVVSPAYSQNNNLFEDVPLPGECEEISLEEIRAICEAYELHDLWVKINDDPPQKSFKSDGCTMWVDTWRGIDLYPACFFHDLKYWSGYPGEEDERLIADLELLLNIAAEGLPAMALVMFFGVRIVGDEQLGMPFSWAFGRSSTEYDCPVDYQCW